MLVEALSSRYHEGALPDKGADIVVCWMDPDRATSEETVRGLAEVGYESGRRYAGGKQDWIDAGLPVEGTYTGGRPPATNIGG